jgi:hypothetical protein
MNSREFVVWFRGFTAAADNFTLTPKQWDTLKDELAQVKDIEDDHDEFSKAWDDTLENDEEEINKRMDIIGQNGNEGTHYWTSTNTGKQLLKD